MGATALAGTAAGPRAGVATAVPGTAAGLRAGAATAMPGAAAGPRTGAATALPGAAAGPRTGAATALPCAAAGARTRAVALPWADAGATRLRARARSTLLSLPLLRNAHQRHRVVLFVETTIDSRDCVQDRCLFCEAPFLHHCQGDLLVTQCGCCIRKRPRIWEPPACVAQSPAREAAGQGARFRVQVLAQQI
jgi:hypothetical protein